MRVERFNAVDLGESLEQRQIYTTVRFPDWLFGEA
jgi:hypothetical protein